MKEVKVSIVVPCWGVEKYLDHCVDSLANQTLKDIEIILVDDESPDRVPEMCDEWALKDSRIKVIHKKNGGLGMACNSGIEAATGEYIAFCDSDDWVDIEMYETMYHAAIKYHADMVFSGLKRVDMEDNPCGWLTHPKEFRLLTTREEINSLSRDMITSPPSVRSENLIQMSAKCVLYRRDVINQYNLRFVSERQIPSEDLHFNLHVMAKSNILCVLPYRFYHYRCNTNSITKKHNEISADRFNRSIKRYEYTIAECEELKIGGDYETRCQRMLLGSARLLISSLINTPGTFSKKKKAVIGVCSSPLLKTTIDKYPVSKMPVVHRLFALATKCESYMLLWMVVKIKRLKDWIPNSPQE